MARFFGELFGLKNHEIDFLFSHRGPLDRERNHCGIYYGMTCNFAHSPNFCDGDKVVFEKTPLARLTKLYTGRTVKIIEESSEQKNPFFLDDSHNYPFTPYQAGKPFKSSSKGSVRGDIMHEMDRGTLDPATINAIAEERTKWHPDFKNPGKNNR